MRKEERFENGIKIVKLIFEPSDYYTEEEKAPILEICNTCEYKKIDSCSVCNCILETLISIKPSKCPINKW
jgi:hypothetical protein